MRVIAGRCKGRVLYSPKGNRIRPTSDRIKEFIFDFIGSEIQNALILDLYSGSGSLSIEALSRGARFSILVDRARQAVDLIYRNLEYTNLASRAQVVRQDVLRYLKRSASFNHKFDVIFADPPYFVKDYQRLIEKIDTDNFLQRGGLFILEHSSQHSVAMNGITLLLEKTKRFGNTTVTIYRNTKGK